MLKVVIFLIFLIEEIQNITLQKNDEVQSALQFLQIYNSFGPVALLIDDTKPSKTNALIFLQNIYSVGSNTQNLNFLLMTFNASGVSGILETTQNNKQRFFEILKEDQFINILGYQNQSTSAAFFAIWNAVQKLPPNSAIVLFLNRKIDDEVLAQHAVNDASKKFIKIFIFADSQDKLLKDVAKHSNGAFFFNSKTKLSEEYFLENFEPFPSMSLLLSRVNLTNENNFNFPIDSDVTGMHVIFSNITNAILTTPKGYDINLLDRSNVAQFSIGSYKEGNEIYLNTTQNIGVWYLSIENTTPFNVTIFLHTRLTANATITKDTPGKILRLGVTGDIESIETVRFLNQDGVPIKSQHSFNKTFEKYEADDIETHGNRELNISFNELPKDAVYAVVDGKNADGQDFRRLSYVNNNQNEFVQPPITIDMGLGSELITQPNRNPQLFFDVTNNGDSPVLARFSCRDEKSILLTMSPFYKWLSPRERTTVRLTLTTRYGSYKDFITFTVFTGQTVSKQVIVDVGESNYHEDRRNPKLDYQFNSDCSKVIFGSCEDGNWIVEVKAKDPDSGLLQISSNPRGIFFPNGFTSGTREEVTGYYSDSCCNPDLQLTAYDRRNNRATVNLNAYRAALGPGAIAAIVLGVILLILLIIGLVFLCRYCCIKYTSKGSYDLPIYKRPFSRWSS